MKIFVKYFSIVFFIEKLLFILFNKNIKVKYVKIEVLVIYLNIFM